MKKIILILLSLVCGFSLPGCTANSSSASSAPSSNTCVLRVRGVDITEGNYVYIDHQKQQAEIPLLAVLKQLGAKIEWISETAVQISSGDHSFVLNASLTAFGLPYPPEKAETAVRRVEGKEFIADTATCWDLIQNLTGATITVDYYNNVVSVM